MLEFFFCERALKIQHKARWQKKLQHRTSASTAISLYNNYRCKINFFHVFSMLLHRI